MELTYSLDDFTVKVNLSGELDHHAAKKIIDGMDRIIDLYLPKELIINMSGVSFMDSSGIAVLLSAYKKLLHTEGNVHVTGILPQPKKVLSAAGLNRYMTIE